MKIKVIKKSDNNLSWSNSCIGKIFTVLYEVEDNFIVDLNSLNKDFISGTIKKSECKICLK